MAPPFPKTTMPYPSTWCPSSGPVIPGGWIYGDVLTATLSCRGPCTPSTCTNRVQAAAPTFIPPAGEYEFPFILFLDSTTPGAVIYYTIDGSTPSSSSLLYPEEGIVLLSGGTVKAIAYADGYDPSDVSSALYTVLNPKAAAPIFSPVPGTYTSSQSLTITSTDGPDIHYTLDGSTPNVGSPIYSGPITLNSTTTVKAIVIASGFDPSDVTSGLYTIGLPTVATPVLSPPTESFSDPFALTITTATFGATIYYTDNGDPPTVASFLYTGPISINDTTTIKAIAILSGYNDSGIGTGVYTFSPVVTTTVYYGANQNPNIEADLWGGGGGNSPFIQLADQVTPLTNLSLNYAGLIIDMGQYCYIALPESTPPPAAFPNGFKNGSFPLNTSDFAGAGEGFASTDANGWPYFRTFLTSENIWIHEYRLLNQPFASIIVTLSQ